MKNLLTPVAGVVLASLIVACSKDEAYNTQIPETNQQPTTAQVTGSVFEPALVPATDARIAQLTAPANFTVTKFADGLGKPRMLTVGASGAVYVTSRDAGTVTLLRDTNNDGVAEQKQVVANIKSVHGLTINGNRMYLVSINDVYVANINGDGTLSEPQRIINDLPDAGQHPNRTIAFGPDGKMYITVGSTCNACAEPNVEHATILQANADGSGRKVYAKGLRNTIGFGWHPQTKEMYGFDHGIDWLGDEQQQEEINLIKEGAFYGWPYIYGDGRYNPHPRPMGDTTYAQILAKTTLPVLQYEAHAAPLGMVFYTANQFPTEYQNDAFVTMRGSWNRTKPSGYKVVRVHFENGKPVSTQDFVTGFLVDGNQAQFGRPVGIAVQTDGSLLFSEDNNGVIYRVSYRR
ncbi:MULTISPECIES: PQQ-dependent sugar dehydrogenase [Spirosoma]|uniref:Sorbosone dehydrogenase family protein n=1 Tax=Spirosoma liriopis TaxID=2937440 RepID=A0ABT0HQ37_9BACT|nr:MULTISPECIES: sorbosone dehydrogenase family protein [Spirosoma]MCK8494282.1 sorbosone dehydrogenase family protein [Spirosoma liriopis]UHG89295.1 sorbosone dehydrogenase family protein [Spirosoma oryzicola]